MPKFPKSFGRRKSTANVLEDLQDTQVVEHSFKVFERPDATARKTREGLAKYPGPPPPGRKPVRAMTSPDDDNMFEEIKINRGSGASNSNTASTTDNSSRLSATSTAPSSTDVSGHDEWRAPHKKSHNDIPLPAIPKSTSNFSLKTAGRSLSWARNKPTPPSPSSKENLAMPSPHSLPALPIQDEETTGRARAVTASSYASTATPPKLNERDLGLSLGGDFSDMFSGFGNRRSAAFESQGGRAMSQSPDMLPTGPASKRTSRNQLAPLDIDRNRTVEPSPFSWGSHHSDDRLMSNTSPVPLLNDRSSPSPQPGPSRPANGNASTSRPQRPGGVADIGLRRSSAISARRHSVLEYGDTVDEDARLLREAVSATRRLNDPQYNARVRDSWALPATTPYRAEDAAGSSWRAGSVESTPRAKKTDSPVHEESIFDPQMAASADLAQRFEEQELSPVKAYSPQNKVMTPAQFERYKQDQERQRNGVQAKDDDEEEEDEPYDDEEDDAEKNRQLAKLRRKQEAHMSVYRQQMMKVTGEAPSAVLPPRLGVFTTQSSPNLVIPGVTEDNEEEDEEIPLAILQAHGFPNKNKPPMRSMGSNPNLRASTMSVAGGSDARLPVFARNLPQDPYFGAGIVYPTNRESLAFGGGAGSVHGGSTRGLPPGGLVGVIATEERSRAMRRGSPNAQGEYGPLPPNGYNDMGIPYNGMMNNGMGPMGPMNPMMMTPGDQAQMQMSQQMQQFMQMQMQFMQMMTSGQGPPGPPGPGPAQPNRPPSQQSFGELPRSNSQPRLGSSHQRAMTMLEPNAAPWMQHKQMYPPSMYGQNGGYAPSIAPSERSNIGLPGRYRPVSHVQVSDSKSRSSTMSGALQGWENKVKPSTMRNVNNSGTASDDDDEEGWEEMTKKREKKKLSWRTKKDNNELKEMLGYAQ